MSRFLNALRPLVRIMPEVKAPDRKVSFREKFIWTAIILILYLIMSELPLYGVTQGEGYDYFFWMRLILASSRGTLMELGIGPIVTAGLVMQLLVGSQLIRVDMSDPMQRSLYTGAQKVLAVFMTAFQAIAYISAGAYGYEIGPGIAVLVFLQLMFAGVVVILMDEMIQKGWGLGSGVSLFIMANVFTQIIWNLFTWAPAQQADLPFFIRAGETEAHTWFLGVVPFLMENLGGLTSGVGQIGVNVCTWVEIWFRPANPRASLSGVIVTFAVFLLVIIMESFRVNIPLQYAKYRGFRGQYPIKLLYVSNIPVIFTQALYANILFITQILWTNPTLGLSSNFWFRLIARYASPGVGEGNYLIPQPVSFIWFLTPPTGLLGEGAMFDPTYALPWLGILRAVGYALLLMALCAGFARLWIDVSGIAPRDISRQLIGAGMQVPGFRRSPGVIEKILERYIPVVAVLGGLLIGALAAFADFFGALSTGVGILLAVGIAKQYMEILAKEQLGEMNPALQALLGTG
jgi:preprotein translocase SecY subunit